MHATPPSENGFYEYDNTSYYIENVENAAVEEYTSPPPEDDFSEYMWMENEEEFDKEVMQHLEEEALMEQCIEAMLADEGPDQHHNAAPTTETTNDAGAFANNPPVNPVEVVKGSNLNPLAAEFVPGNLSVSSQGLNKS